MQLIDGVPVFSATDLVGYLACEHLTQLERAAVAGLVDRPDRPDPELDIIRRRGFQHEARYLEELREKRLRVATVERDDEASRGERIRRQAEDTIAAMASGADVVYQATFFDGRWLGYADFLLRVDDAARPSVWGPYHYEVADTKLARHVKAGAVLQICSYVEQLARVQGVAPRNMHVVLGGSARETAKLRVDDYMAYYRAAKRRFEEVVLGTEGAPAEAAVYPPAHTYPEPTEHCDVCRWSELCVRRRRDDDHLSLVAGISAGQRKSLVSREIDTVVRLAGAPLPFQPALDGTSAASIERVREQARIQVAGRKLPKPIHELILPAPGEAVEAERGLATLPEPDAGDLFFDIEGDPYAFDDGIDYLFGVLDIHGAFTAFWSFDPDHPEEVTLAGEKAAFERFLEFVGERRGRHPKMHIYHYAPYEPTALKRLMGRHATGEQAVDELLRGGVLVDLFRAVRQGIRASVESYSIKRLEPLYDFEREIDLRDAGSSIVAFEEWLELGDGERPTSEILARIERYNRDDVESNRRLRDWLEERRMELAAETGQEVRRPAERKSAPDEELSASDARVQELVDRLTRDVPVDPAERDDEQAARWLLAQLLSFHRRENKAAYWDFFRRIGLNADELVEEDGAIGQLTLVSVSDPWKPTPRSRDRITTTYRFPPQEHRDVGDKSRLFDPQLAQERPGEWIDAWELAASVRTVDDVHDTVELVWMADAEIRHPESIVALNLVPDTDLRASVFRLGEWVAEHGVDAPGAWQAGRDLLLRRAPRCGQPEGAPLAQPPEDDLDAARRLATCLDAGTLAIQGPPGSGKTYTGARMIARLLQTGKRIGISATSHKVIANFLKHVVEAAAEAAVEAKVVQKVSGEDQGSDAPGVVVTTDNPRVRRGVADGEFNVAAGTAWLWAPESSADLVDVLFVDEAGQMSLANVLAMSGAARSLVLLGDPQQLDQPLQGSHPPGAERSALAHLLGDEDTMPPDRGLFLEHTWRLHPAITRFTSEVFYEGRLESRSNLVRQSLGASPPVGGSGVRLLAAEHADNANESPEEAREVAHLVRALVESGATWTDRDGRERKLQYEDVLIVAPYNAQVGAVLRELPEARVGTVDKFQGQEAPISIYTMTSSSPDDAPRGMSFLYSRNRLNVATSRARCVAVVVASPELLRVRARSPQHMRLANALCRFVELADEQGRRR